MHANKKLLLRSIIVSSTFLGFTISLSSHACTRIFWNNNHQAKVVARSMDLFISDVPKMLVFPRGMQRDGLAPNNPIKWQSKYGSVVINAFNSPAYSDGLNEAGLGAHLLYLHDTKYETTNPALPQMSNLMWAQYFLDNDKTVNEALKDATKFQVMATKVHNQTWPIHLALEDASGDSATIEYINGKMIVHHGPEYRVLANEPSYDQQLQNLKRYKLFGGTLSMPGDINSLSRFVRASSYLKTLPQPTDYKEAIAGVFSVIRTVMVPFGADDTSGTISTDTWATRWVAVADLTNKIYYFNSTTSPNILWVDLNHLNFSEGAQELELDIINPKLGEEVVKNFTPKKET